MWERWQQGESLRKIAQLFNRNHSSTLPDLAATGGIRPAQRYRFRLALTLAERQEISSAVVAEQSIRPIAMSRTPGVSVPIATPPGPQQTARAERHRTQSALQLGYHVPAYDGQRRVLYLDLFMDSKRPAQPPVI
jgi:hypothetical protein